MSNEYDDEVFLDVGDVTLSRGAFQLHGHGMVNSIQAGTPGFVSDDYLNSIRAETTTSAAELCVAARWERVEGGYRIVNEPLLAEVVAFTDRMACGAEICAKAGHRPDPESSTICEVCLALLDR